MKKLVLFFAVVLAVSFASCGNKQKEAPAEAPAVEAPATEAAAPAATDSSAAATEAAAPAAETAAPAAN